MPKVGKRFNNTACRDCRARRARQERQELAYCIDVNDAWSKVPVSTNKGSRAAKPASKDVRRTSVVRSRPAPSVTERKAVGYWMQEDEDPQKKSCCVIM